MDNKPDLKKAIDYLTSKILIDIFKNENKHPVDEWCYELDVDQLECTLKDEHGDYLELIQDDVSEFTKMLNNSFEAKLNYFYNEGFLRKENNYYYPVSDAEIQESIDKL